jgi:hypothetical protein
MKFTGVELTVLDTIYKVVRTDYICTGSKSLLGFISFSKYSHSHHLITRCVSINILYKDQVLECRNTVLKCDQ